MGRRALREALAAAKGSRGYGAGGEQTVQGLLADAATDLDAAMLLTWKAASAASLSLADASMAKLAATEATQRAVAYATQVVGADSFRRGHIVEQLAQDVRALELFAGRTEALREAVADEILPGRKRAKLLLDVVPERLDSLLEQRRRHLRVIEGHPDVLGGMGGGDVLHAVEHLQGALHGVLAPAAGHAGYFEVNMRGHRVSMRVAFPRCARSVRYARICRAIVCSCRFEVPS
jgi:hypothetical protein